MNLSDRIQSLRKAAGLSQEELADRIGVSRQAVSKWESEQSAPDLDKIILLSECFGVTTDYLLKGIEPAEYTAGPGLSRTAGQALYLASAAFLAIGLFAAFGGWYAEQSDSAIWGSMIVQVVGAIGYFAARMMSPVQAPAALTRLDAALALFMPVSLLVSLMLRRPAAPYPTNVVSGLLFWALYAAACALAFRAIRKKKE